MLKPAFALPPGTPFAVGFVALAVAAAVVCGLFPMGVSVAAVQGAAIESVTTKQAVVLVFLDQTVNTAKSDTARIDRDRLEMTLEKQSNGTWLIAERMWSDLR